MDGWSVEERIRAWAVFGGVPYYLFSGWPGSISLMGLVERRYPVTGAPGERVYTCHMGTTKTARVHLRIAAEDKELFERAGSLHEESLTEFLVESGRERAERLLADRTRFVLDDVDWRAFTAALDRPAQARPELARLFARPRPE